MQPRIGLGASFLALLLVIAPLGARAQDVPFTVAQVFFQLNDTDGDLGFHVKVDGEAWKTVTIDDPLDRLILSLNVRGRLAQQGGTEFALESAEPGFDELPPAAFFARFPAGIYDVGGITLDGAELDSEVTITHVMPAPIEGIEVSSEPAGEDCELDPGPEVSGPVVISWDPVTTSHPTIGKSGPVKIDSYEVAIERTSPVLPTKAVMTVNLPASTTELEVPEVFLALGDAFKFQILARNAGGNETATESCFALANP